MKIVKDLFRKFNYLDPKSDDCDNCYYLNVLIHFRFHFLDETTIEKFNKEEWLEYVDTLKACFIIVGAIKECE